MRLFVPLSDLYVLQHKDKGRVKLGKVILGYEAHTLNFRHRACPTFGGSPPRAWRSQSYEMLELKFIEMDYSHGAFSTFAFQSLCANSLKGFGP
jgi:hypothetical protein